MRSASIVRRGVMDKISAAHKTFTYKVKGNQARPSTDLPDNGFRSEHTENYLNVLVHSIKQLVSASTAFIDFEDEIINDQTNKLGWLYCGGFLKLSVENLSL